MMDGDNTSNSSARPALSVENDSIATGSPDARNVAAVLDQNPEIQSDSGAIMPQLPYGFAKAKGLIVLRLADQNSVVLGRRVSGVSPLLGQGPSGQPSGSPDIAALVEARRFLGRKITLEPLGDTAFDQALSEGYAVGEFASGFDEEEKSDDNLDDLAGGLSVTADLLDSDDEAPVIRLINGLIAEAIRNRGSDIHIEPFEDNLSVRLRIDGVLQEVIRLAARSAPVLVSRIKVMARLDIAEKRIPQDGRISLTLGGRAIDVRVSTLPSRHGERVVLRLLDRDQARFSIEDLGMPLDVRTRFEAALKEPNGVILVTGPTGSGKTTTLYAGLSMLNDKTRNILTVEDPVEYALDGVGQTQVNTKVGMTFAAGLRAMLRQDPDVVMVGEIRDVETAEIAIQASLTGHLVLSTVHTNSAISAITRLRDMGVESFLLASTVKAIVAQRLVRRLCTSCRVETDLPRFEDRQRLGLPTDAPLYQAKGCLACGNTGYQGRIGLYEIVRIDTEMRQFIHDEVSESTMTDHAFKHSKTLMGAGLEFVASGITSLDEVMRVCRSDGDGNAGL